MARPHNTIPPHAAERPHLFWRNVQIGKPDECWNWKAHVSQYGYGVAIRSVGGIKTKLQAHRLAYFIQYGDDPRELCVCHICDNPPCCNPSHLFLGTTLDNNRDMWRKGRANSPPPPHPKGEQHGCSKLTRNQVREIRGKYVPLVYTHQMLAREFGVSQSLISKILNGPRWKGIE